MKARKPEPRPQSTYTDWPAARPPRRVGGTVPTRPPYAVNVMPPVEDSTAATPDEPGYGHGV